MNTARRHLRHRHLRRRALVTLAGLTVLAPLAALAQGGCALIIGLGPPPDAGDGATTDSGSSVEAGPEPDAAPDFLPSDPLCIAEGQNQPRALAVANEVVFWANEGDQTLWRADLRQGGKPTRMLKTAPLVIQSLAVYSDSDNVYWSATANTTDCTGTPSIGRAPRTAEDTNPEIVWSSKDNCHQPSSIFVDGTNLYWTISPYDPMVEQMPKGQVGGMPKGLAATGQPTSIWVDGANAYWIERSDASNQHPGSINRAIISDFQSAVKLADDQDGVQITGDDINVYWVTTSGTVRRYQKEVPNSAVDLVGADVYRDAITSLSVDDRNVYYTVPAEGEIRRVPTPGGGFSTVVPKLDDPQRVVVDAKRIYWTSFAGGKVCLMKKPPSP